MIFQGIDTAAYITADAARTLKANGISFAGRYLGPKSWGKTITKTEAEALHNAGLAILLCYETSATRMRGGAGAGETDGLNAMQYAQELGAPQGTVIFFAADYNVPAGDYALCESYILAAQAALGCTYIAGLYGPEKIVSYLSERGACDKYWQCVAWSNQFLPVANVRQYEWQGGPNAKALAAKIGFAVDMDAAESLSGLWTPKQPEPEPATHWYDDTVRWAIKEGVVTGPTIEAARPEDYATRAETMQMIRNYNRRFEAEDAKRESGLLAE